MGKKASVFLLRKSSKKKFNFYEDYKLVGTTFNYTMYFKQIFFFHYWLKYTLQQLAIAPIDFFYIKRSNRLLVFVLVNKKYLLTFRELYDRSSNKNLNYSFLPYKQLMVLKWSRSKSQSFYNKKRNSISLGTKTKSFVTFLLKHCHFELLNFFFYLSFFYQLYWFFCSMFFTFRLVCVQQVINGGRWRLSIFGFIRKYRQLSNLFCYLKLFLSAVFSRSSIFAFMGRYNKREQVRISLRQLNRVRWYAIKTICLLPLESQAVMPVGLVFLNFNDMQLFSKNKVAALNFLQKRHKTNSLLSLITKVDPLRNILVNLLHKGALRKNFFLQRLFQLFFTFFLCPSFRVYLSLAPSHVGLFWWFYLHLLSGKMFWTTKFYYRQQNMVSQLVYYVKHFNTYYYTTRNVLWHRYFSYFYQDLKKNCLFYTVNDPYFRPLVFGLFFSLVLEQPAIFSTVVSQGLMRTRRHHFFLNNIENVLIIGLKFIQKYKKTTLNAVTVKVRGKFNGKLKREKRVVIVGEKIKLQNIEQKLRYSFSEAFTYAGAFGIKVWFRF